VKKTYSAILVSTVALVSAWFSMPQGNAAAIGTDTYSIPLPQENIVTSTRVGDLSATDHSPAGPVELTVSSWAPRNLTLPSFVEETSNFGASTMPAVSMNFFWFPERSVAVNPEIGVSFLQMTRTGTLRYSGINENVNQSLFLVPLRIGARLSPRLLRWSRMTPYAGAALLPTFAILSRSPLDNGGPSLGLPFELSFGVEFAVPQLSILTGGAPAALNIGGVSTWGTLNSGDFSGFGLVVGLKI
jgi:hypothetical protein